MLFLAIAALALWLIILLLPWMPWLTREKWDVSNDNSRQSLAHITVLIPARNEEQVIDETLKAVLEQGPDLSVVVIDDQSTDKTQEYVGKFAGQVSLLQSAPRPPGWSGKLWALEQGRKQVLTPVLLLLDADIKLEPGLIQGLCHHMTAHHKDFVSLMARPVFETFWDRLLMPAFVYFFKLLYPFALANSNSKYVAAAAGGCIMMKSNVMERIGGFGNIGTVLIDDCKLAGEVKKAGFKTWLGLTHSVSSIRPYNGLRKIWDMVARTAYEQLNRSAMLLFICTCIMALAYFVPLVALFFPVPITLLGSLTLLIMFITYLPTLSYYRRSWWWVLLMPVTAAMFLGMTWTSAIRYWGGERMRWRGRTTYVNNKSQ